MPRALSPPRLLVFALLAAPVLGCTVGPDFKAPAPEAPATWSSAGAPTPGPKASLPTTAPVAEAGAWWILFGDAELSSLIDRARAQNLDAREAVLRIAEARAQRDVTAAALWPALTVNASAQTNRLSETTPQGQLFNRVPGFPNPYAQYQLGVAASWEIDLFGRVRREVEAANAQTAAQVEDSRAVLVATLGDVGRAYIDLRGAQAKRQILADEVAADRELLDLASQRRDAGLASDIDVVRVAADASAAQAGQPTLERQITGDINELSKLLAREPGALLGELQTAAPVPPVPPSVPVGLPADLARRRPDIREAEARLHAATAQVGVAVADLYPRLMLGPQLGLQSQSLSALTDWASRFVTAGPVIELPIFDAGQRRATVRLSDVRAREATLDYRRTVLGALNEVDNALAAYATEQSRRAALAATVAQDRDAVDLARQRWAGGLGAFIDVLDAERVLRQNELALADSSTAVSVDLVLLYKALGGGWTEA